MIGGSWKAIQQSEIKCLLKAEAPLECPDDEIVQAFRNLCTMLSRSSNLTIFDKNIYLDAMEDLILVYKSQPIDCESSGRQSSGMVTTWPITLSAEYTELLHARKPEALIVMAHFAILLHKERVYWAVGNAGRALLAAIEEYLGSKWVHWLFLPKHFVTVVD